MGKFKCVYACGSKIFVLFIKLFFPIILTSVFCYWLIGWPATLITLCSSSVFTLVMITVLFSMCALLLLLPILYFPTSFLSCALDVLILTRVNVSELFSYKYRALTDRTTGAPELFSFTPCILHCFRGK